MFSFWLYYQSLFEVLQIIVEGIQIIFKVWMGRHLPNQIHRASFTFEIFSKSILMLSFKMGFQCRSLCKAWITKMASKIPFFLMNCIGVTFQCSARRKFFFAQSTGCFLWLNTFMIYSDVSSQSQGWPICFSRQISYFGAQWDYAPSFFFCLENFPRILGRDGR